MVFTTGFYLCWHVWTSGINAFLNIFENLFAVIRYRPSHFDQMLPHYKWSLLCGMACIFIQATMKKFLKIFAENHHSLKFRGRIDLKVETRSRIVLQHLQNCPFCIINTCLRPFDKFWICCAPKPSKMTKRTWYAKRSAISHRKSQISWDHI